MHGAVPILSTRKLLLAWFASIVCGLVVLPLILILPATVAEGPAMIATGLAMAPVYGLVFGPMMAPASFGLTLALQLALILGLRALARRHAVMRSRWSWAGAGLLAGLLIGAALAVEMSLLAGQSFWITLAAAPTGALCALFARRVVAA